MIMSLITANTDGSMKRTITNALFFVSYCLGNIAGPFAFRAKEAPVYSSGIVAMLTAYCVEVVALLGFAVYMAYLNKKKETACADASINIEDYEARDLASFRDLTDKENSFFRYSY